MATQRERQSGEAPPDRQITRNALTSFQEGMSPEKLSLSGPTRIGDTTVGQLTVDDGSTDAPKLQMKDRVGLQWLDPTGQVVVETFRHSYSFNGTRLSRQGIWAEDDVGADIPGLFGDIGDNPQVFGKNVGRVCFIDLVNIKVPGDENSVHPDNHASIALSAQVKAGASPTFIQLDAQNDGNFLRLNADPSQFAKYAAGTRVSTHYQFLTASDSARAAGANTDMVINAVVWANRLYRVHLHSQFLVGAAGGTYRINLTEDGSIVSTLTRVNPAETGNAALFRDSAVLYIPSSTGTRTLRVQNDAASSNTVALQASAANPRMFWIEDIGPA